MWKLRSAVKRDKEFATWSKMSKEALSAAKPETIIKILLAKEGIKWHGSEYDRFDFHVPMREPPLKHADVDGIVNVHFRSTNLVLIFEIDENGHVHPHYIQQPVSDRLLLGIRPFYPEDAAVFVCVRLPPIIEG